MGGSGRSSLLSSLHALQSEGGKDPRDKRYRGGVSFRVDVILQDDEVQRSTAGWKMIRRLPWAPSLNVTSLLPETITLAGCRGSGFFFFWRGDSTQMLIVLMALEISLPLHLLSKKSPKKSISKIL